MVTTFISFMFVSSIFFYIHVSHVFSIHILWQFYTCFICILTPYFGGNFMYQGPGPILLVFATDCGRPGLRWACVCGGFRSAGSSLALGGFHEPVRDGRSVSQCRFVLGTRSVSRLSAGYPVYVGGFAAPVRPWRSESSSGGRSLSIVLRPRPAVWSCLSLARNGSCRAR